MTQNRNFHLITDERKGDFVARGYKGRHFFPHRAYYLPRPLPEQVKTARTLWNIKDPDACWCVLLYASDEWLCRFPTDVFFDAQVMIHNEHMGRAGLVASAPLYIDGDRLCTDEHQSDLVQRIIHRREHKSQIEKRFGTWHHMLLNSILNFAVIRGMREIHMPAARRVVHDYIGGNVNPEMFDRLYDQNIQYHFKAQLRGDVWVIPVSEHRDKLVPMTPAVEAVSGPARSACIIHDVDAVANVEPESLRQQVELIAEVERRLEIRSTWCVPGQWLTAFRQPIEEAGGTVAFRAFDDARFRYAPQFSRETSRSMATLTRLIRRSDHALRRRLGYEPRVLPTASAICTAASNRLRGMVGAPPLRDTLRRCRECDYYLKGYRRTPLDADAGLSDQWLGYYHFEYVIDNLSPASVNRLQYGGGLVTLPAPLHLHDLPKDLERIEETLERNAVTVLNLPFADSGRWLDHVEKLASLIRERHTKICSVQDVVNAFHFSRAV